MALGAPALVLGGSSAWAACTLGGSVYTCAGSTPSTTLTGAPLNVVVDPTFASTGAGGSGLRLTGTGGTTLTQTGSGAIIGSSTTGSQGLDVSNTGGGNVSLVLTGPVSTLNATAAAVRVVTDAATQQVTLQSSGTLSSPGSGIVINSSAATGLHTITATAPITVGTGSGIWLSTSGAGNSITATDITGGYRGVYSTYVGTSGGSNIVTINGSVLNTPLGISAINSAASSGNMAVTVTGSTSGRIQANNSSTTGSTQVTVGGSVADPTYYGINATSAGSNVDVSTGGDVTAVTYGINGEIRPGGTGNATIHAGGNVTTSTSVGIQGLNAGSAGSVSVVTAPGKTVTATSTTNGTGIFTGITEAGAGAITIQADSNVVGGLDGIGAFNDGAGDTTVVATANVTASSRSGIAASDWYDGPTGTGAVTITTTGAVLSNGTVAGAAGLAAGIYNPANTKAVTVNESSGSVRGFSGIVAENYGSGATAVNVGGVVAGTGGTGAGIQTSTKAGNAVAINLSSGADVSAASGVAILDGAGNATVTASSGSKIAGEVHLGDGSDTLILQNGADITGVTVLDGGDDTSTADGFVDVLTFQNVTLNVGSMSMVNWETINLYASTLTLNSPTVAAAMGGAQLYVDSASTVVLGASMTLNDSVSNAGTVSTANGATGDAIVVTGNYTGGGAFNLDTQLGDSASPTDVLTINGNVTGTTTLRITNVAGLGAATTGNGILVVSVGGTSPDNAFVLAGGSITVGGFVYTLHKVGNNWYLQSAPVPTPPPPPPTPSRPIPTLSELGLGLSALLLAATGFAAQRNNPRRPRDARTRAPRAARWF
ncbi:IPTL-CTERM sorting domain-containing protein [Acidovorax sp.]|uniref:IPTL-CTERM sorting domain-containing protein n=1 Tax=Acidovorax sp. TaxID=1872122 RepID=UPI0025B8B2F2|nr:IPTL-CTERM sorting domain-containing protein [Acidovorax sp.]